MAAAAEVIYYIGNMTDEVYIIIRFFRNNH